MSIALRARLVSPVRRAFDLLPYAYMILGLIGVVSVVCACAQWMGMSFWDTYGDQPTGLFFSPIVAGSFLGLTIVALATICWWEPIPVLILGLHLAGNRGGWVVAVVGTLAIWCRQPLGLLFIILLGAFAVTITPSISDLERINIWHAGLINLSFFGNGWGSFNDVWIVRDKLAYHPEFAHSDYLQLIFELGVYSLPIFCVFAYALSKTQAQAWPLLVAYATLASFSFPTYVPATAAIGILALAATLGANNGQMES